ncbi:MAG: GNAT family N-acetyltransferase [Methylobacterium mesophilicum]|nr:GNAT family N-acetyltransferase [Methylobacterium mesophilicum]
MHIRRIRPSESDALFEICLKTADAGSDGTASFSDPRMPGYLWAAPYGRFEPDFAFVLVQGETPVGYVVATPDSAAFQRRLVADWYPLVRRELDGLEPSRPKDAMILDRLASPEPVDDRLVEDYPAHLHINILPDAQSAGWGRRLIETELNALAAHGVRGVHLGVDPLNESAMGFYRHLGFERLDRDGRVTFTKPLRA